MFCIFLKNVCQRKLNAIHGKVSYILLKHRYICAVLIRLSVIYTLTNKGHFLQDKHIAVNVALVKDGIFNFFLKNNKFV